MEKEKIERINELAHIAKERALTQEEQDERQALRAQYLAEFRASMEQTLEAVRIKEPDGTMHPLTRRDDQKPSKD